MAAPRVGLTAGRCDRVNAAGTRKASVGLAAASTAATVKSRATNDDWVHMPKRQPSFDWAWVVRAWGGQHGISAEGAMVFCQWVVR
jgi:hypothetical protein